MGGFPGDEYEFLARDAARGAFAVPGNVRGFALLQASWPPAVAA